MTWMMAAIVVVPLLGLAAPAAQAEARARVAESFPPGAEVVLGRGENFYVRIDFTSDTPVSLWARPLLRGKPVDAYTNASSPHDGSGEALGWFSFIKPGEVDEIRIVSGDGSARGTTVLATYPVRVTGTDAPAAARPRPEWVERLIADEKAAQRADYERRMREPVSTGTTVLMGGFMLAVLAVLFAGFAAPAWGLWNWRGGWRVAAAVPACLIAFVALRIAAGTARDPTSHNLWPFAVLIAGALSVAIMALLGVARRIARARA